jgi:hypothetical protein
MSTSKRRAALSAGLLAATLAACAHRAPAPPTAPTSFKLDPRKTTCAEFVGLGETIQPRVIAWMDGYSRAGTLRQQDVAQIDIDRQTDVAVVAPQLLTDNHCTVIRRRRYPALRVPHRPVPQHARHADHL